MSGGFAPVAAPLRVRGELGRKAGKFVSMDSAGAELISVSSAHDITEPFAVDPKIHDRLTEELHRSHLVREIVRRLGSIAASAAGSEKAGAQGLFPGMVFEGLSCNASQPLEPLIPDPNVILAAGGPVCLFRRLRTLLHDSRNPAWQTPEQLDQVAWERARAALQVIADAKLSVVDAKLSQAAVAITIDAAEHGFNVSWASCGVKHFVAREHYNKLKLLYRGAESEWSQRLFLLLHRYFNLGGCQDSTVEGGWHGAVPARVLRAMHSELHVTGECFASPFNCTFPQFCSAFPDTDGAFGSLGSFFHLREVTGVMEANPPFDHMVALRMAKHMTSLLSAKDACCAFLVVLPYSDRGKPLESLGPAVAAMRESGYCVCEISVDASDCDYVDGAQQCSTRSTSFLARLDTRLFLLMSPAAHAAQLRVATPETALQKVHEAWRNTAPPATDTKRLRDAVEDQGP